MFKEENDELGFFHVLYNLSINGDEKEQMWVAFILSN